MLPFDPIEPVDEESVGLPRLPIRSPEELELDGDDGNPVAAWSGVGGRPGSDGDPEVAFQASGGGESGGALADDGGIPEIVEEPDPGGFPPFAVPDALVEPASSPVPA